MERHIDGILLDSCRSQNIHRVPLITVGQSLMCEVNCVTREYHDVVSGFHKGAALSEKWVYDFLPLAVSCRPEPGWEAIDGITAVCFDNLTCQVDYKSYSSRGETGLRLDMTNWFSSALPK